MPRKKRELLPDVGVRIRQARTALGLSQQELASMIRKTASALSKYEAGQVSEVHVLLSLSRALGRSVEWLLHGDRPRPLDPADIELREQAAQDAVPQLGGPPRRVRILPTRYRDRYLQRAGEVINRAQRELAEYTKVLEAEYKADKARHKRKE